MSKEYIKQLEEQNEHLQQKLAEFQRCKCLVIPTLTDSWVDRDYLILHAVFAALVDFVEKEYQGDMENHFSQEDIDNCKDKKEKSMYIRDNENYRKIKALYNWWKKHEPLISSGELENYEEENNKLKEVIDLRKYFWT